MKYNHKKKEWYPEIGEIEELKRTDKMTNKEKTKHFKPFVQILNKMGLLEKVNRFLISVNMKPYKK